MVTMLAAVISQTMKKQPRMLPVKEMVQLRRSCLGVASLSRTWKRHQAAVSSCAWLQSASWLGPTESFLFGSRYLKILGWRRPHKCAMVLNAQMLIQPQNGCHQQITAL